jgi:serine/threonine protein kinase
LIQIPGYDIEEKIGEGGSAEVYMARRQQNGQKCALKLLNEKYSATPSMKQRVLREAQWISRLRHQNIVKIFKYGTHKDRLYLVLEYLGKGSLSEYARLSLRDRLKAMIQICDGIACIHATNIVHRDLKPSNIMFGDDGIPRLVDFGISLFLGDDATRLTHTNMVMGSLTYMSPEQQTNPSEVDHRTDIYSLGGIMYEIFTGSKPVGRFDEPKDLIKGFDPAFSETSMKCLHPKPDMRYQKVTELQDELIKHWKAGLYADKAAPQEAPSFDVRLGYWIKKLQLGTSAERMEARERILRNAEADDAKELLEIAENSGAEVRDVLIPLLGKFRFKPAFPFLLNQLANPMLVRSACQALGLLGQREAVDPLYKLVRKRETYSYYGLEPLVLLGGERVLKMVLPYLRSKDPTDRHAAVKALNHSPSPKLLGHLKKQIKIETDHELQSQMQQLANKWELL